MKKTVEITGIKSNINLYVQDPVLWWPQDMGEPFLYDYRLEYYEDDRLASVWEGKLGIREFTLQEKPRQTEGGLSCGLLVNGIPVFLKGANWVPLDIMTGRVSSEKYEHYIELARRANYNCLRVWGGGIYEKEYFYQLCDRKGILIWQDLAFACADIPDDYPGFNEMVIPEVEYQVRRLCNHASVALWCGGNEKTGAIGKSKSRGDRLVNYTLRGIVHHLDPTRPYFPSSPWGYSDISNAQDAGDSHCNSYQRAMANATISDFRRILMTFTPSIASEIAVQGCSSIKALRRFLPEEKLWPINEIWDLHMTRNPYDSTGTTFSQQQFTAAEELFGDIDSFDDFVKKSMAVHSEFVKSDVEFHRARKGDCNGAMLWMFSDVWPCGTWAVIDYDKTPKAAYYSSMRVNRPLIGVIVQTKAGIKAVVVNDTMVSRTLCIRMGQMTLDGQILFEKSIDSFLAPSVSSLEVMTLDHLMYKDINSFLFMEIICEEETIRNVFFPYLWKDITWPDSELVSSVRKKACEGCRIELSISCRRYARMVQVDFDGIEHAFLSDNYFDLIPGESKTIIIESPHPVNIDSLHVYDWNSNGQKGLAGYGSDERIG